jgi:enolase-phosphatase E1
MEFSGRGILLDIEGTTSSLRFVHDAMFPFVRRELDDYLEAHWDSPSLQAAGDQIAQDAGYSSLDAWTVAEPGDPRQRVRDEVLRLMDGDIKATGLKQLQGLIWRSGFESGELRAPVYADVLPALESWRHAGLDLRIFSSGSVAAQKLFFGHTEVGDLLGFFAGHYDTTLGSKKEAESYRKIVQEFGLPPGDLLFVSDVVAELDAARTAGMRTALSVRPGNAAVLEVHDHPVITGFDQIRHRPASQIADAP